MEPTWIESAVNVLTQVYNLAKSMPEIIYPALAVSVVGLLRYIVKAAKGK